jgi:hypothetical protein
VVIKNEPALRSVASHQQQGHDRPAALGAPLVAAFRRSALSRRPGPEEAFPEASSRVETADEPGEHSRVGAILHLEPHLAVSFVEVNDTGGGDCGTPFGI